MANKRDLKKQVKKICGNMATECLIAAQYVKGVEPKKMYAIVNKLAELQSHALTNISFDFDKVPSEFASMQEYRKAKESYFKQAYTAFREKFNGRIQEIVKEMNAALPQEVKDANKAAANA